MELKQIVVVPPGLFFGTPTVKEEGDGAEIGNH